MSGYLSTIATGGAFPSAPDSAALSVTGDLDIRVKMSLADWSPAGGNSFLAGKHTAGDIGYRLWIQGFDVGKLTLNWSEDGSADILVESTVKVDTVFSANEIGWVRATLDVNGGAAGVGRVTFYTSSNGTDWAQLGATVDTGSAPTSIHDSDQPLWIGAREGAADMTTGNWYQVQIYDGIAGTLEFDADFTDLTSAEVTAKAFAEDSANAATVTLGGSAWTYTFIGDLPSGWTVWEYGDTLLAYLIDQGATSTELVGALNELNSTTGVEYDLAYRTYFNL